VSDLTPVDRVRPSTVTISSYLLYFVAILQLISMITVFAVLNDYRRVYEEAFEGTEAEGMGGTIGAISLVAIGVIGVLVAAVLVILATFNNRGRNGSRITTWILGGIWFCCSGFGLLSNALGSSMNFGSSSDPNVPDQEEITRRLEEVLPGWFTPVSIIIGVLTVLALLAALVLLALPASNAFFRKQPAGWEPPVPGSAYPQVPGYPTSPYQPGEPPLPPPPPGGNPPAGPPPGYNPPGGNPPGGNPPGGYPPPPVDR
jgi:hypothetical protein